MKNESAEFELELQPIDSADAPGFTERGAAGFSLLPAKTKPANDDDGSDLTLVRLERFSFK